MENYNFFEKKLHHLLLGNQFLKKTLFTIEKMIFYKKKFPIKLEKHIYITGLPRSGTKILLEFIYLTKEFASLTYADMPFIMATNLFSKIHKNKNFSPKERMHNDGIKFDLNTPESFDDVFFQTFNIEDCFNNLDIFVSLILQKYKKTKYLSKNNNNYKRIDLINSVFPNAIILIPYRNPLQQAYSLLNQHKRFCEKQKKNKFILEYMNSLGHNEFGLNYKSWNLSIDYHDRFTLNHWLEQWYLYYKNIIKHFGNNKNVILIYYDNLCNNPDLVKKLILKLDLTLADYSNFFKLSIKEFKDNYDEKILSKCLDVQIQIKKLSNNLL